MLADLRWPYEEPTCWPNVGPMSKITFGQCLFYDVQTCTYYHGQYSAIMPKRPCTLKEEEEETLAQQRAYTLAYCWANIMALRRTNMLALRRADEQNYIGPTPFYDVEPTCTYNIVMLSGIVNLR